MAEYQNNLFKLKQFSVQYRRSAVFFSYTHKGICIHIRTETWSVP